MAPSQNVLAGPSMWSRVRGAVPRLSPGRRCGGGRDEGGDEGGPWLCLTVLQHAKCAIGPCFSLSNAFRRSDTVPKWRQVCLALSQWFPPYPGPFANQVRTRWVCFGALLPLNHVKLQRPF